MRTVRSAQAVVLATMLGTVATTAVAPAQIRPSPPKV